MFTRKSTGLVRQGRWIDTFVFNSSSSWLFGPLVFALSSLTWLPGDDLVSAEGIAVVFALAIAGMYALLTARMPRSGGDYVFNSRILHPSFGFAFNFSLTVWQLFSAAFTLYFVSNYALSPGLEVLGFYSGNQFLTQVGQALGNPVNSLVVASILNVLFTLLFTSGIKRTFRTLNVLWALTLLGTIVMVASLALTSVSDFRASFNQYVQISNGTGTVPDPFSFVVQQGATTSPQVGLALPAIAICASSVIWIFWETYVAGEVSKADHLSRNLSTMAGAAIFNGSLFIVLVFLLYSKVGSAFIIGATNLSFIGTIFSSPLQAITATIILATGNFVSALIVIIAITLGTTILLLPALYLQPVRSLFAWSMDRIVPTKMSEVSSRLNTPVFSTALIFAVIEAALFLITVEYQSMLVIFYAVIIAPAFSSIFPTSLSAIFYKYRRVSGLSQKGGRENQVLALLGLISLGFILFMTYIFVTNEAAFYLDNTLVMMNFVFIPIGFLIYFASYAFRRSKDKLDLNKIALEIPPE